MIFTFGKYNGELIDDVYKKEPSYILFLLNKKWFPIKYPQIEIYCKNLHQNYVNNDINDKVLYIYTDGACSNNGSSNSKCGIGVHFSDNNEDISEKMIIDNPTNNKAELLAILKALEIIDGINKEIVIYTDSKYSINCIEVWYINWKKKNELNNKKNIDIIEKIYPLYIKNKVKFKHIYSHTNLTDTHSIGNFKADKLARDSIN